MDLILTGGEVRKTWSATEKKIQPPLFTERKKSNLRGLNLFANPEGG